MSWNMSFYLPLTLITTLLLGERIRSIKAHLFQLSLYFFQIHNASQNKTSWMTYDLNFQIHVTLHSFSSFVLDEPMWSISISPSSSFKTSTHFPIRISLNFNSFCYTIAKLSKIFLLQEQQQVDFERGTATVLFGSQREPSSTESLLWKINSSGRCTYYKIFIDLW